MNEGDVSEPIGAHYFGMTRAERLQCAAQDLSYSAAQSGEGDDNDE